MIFLFIICIVQSTFGENLDLGNTTESMGSTSATLNQIDEGSEEGKSATELKQLRKEIEKLDDPEKKSPKKKKKSLNP